jgi:hypothetical protein
MKHESILNKTENLKESIKREYSEKKKFACKIFCLGLGLGLNFNPDDDDAYGASGR